MAFNRFIGIDWSGAKGHRHKGIAVAEADAAGGIRLIRPDAASWSRTAVLDLVVSARPGTAVTMDSSFSLPFEDAGVFLPGLTARSAKELWTEVDTICEGDDDLFGGSFVDRFADHYQLSKTPGPAFKRRYRITETWNNAAFKERCESCYHLIGPSQIGKGGLSTMRFLHQLQQRSGAAVWPFDAINQNAVTIFEAFATTWRDGFRGKIRDIETLLPFLDSYGAAFVQPAPLTITDDEADAILMAAGLRSLFVGAGKGPYLPREASPAILETEGWIMTGEPPCN